MRLKAAPTPFGTPTNQSLSAWTQQQEGAAAEAADRSVRHGASTFAENTDLLAASKEAVVIVQ
jgi:hypothetical protein